MAKLKLQTKSFSMTYRRS